MMNAEVSAMMRRGLTTQQTVDDAVQHMRVKFLQIVIRMKRDFASPLGLMCTIFFERTEAAVVASTAWFQSQVREGFGQ